MDSQSNDVLDGKLDTMAIKISNSTFGVHNGEGCSSNSHQLVATSSFEINGATSLSEDSGLPHTNSSISSGDSIRVGLCKFEFEVNK